VSKFIRIIPRLDIKGPNVVKGIHFEGLRVVGRPELFAKRYYEMGADELIYIDCVASLYGRNSLEEIVHRASTNVFLPLTVGGGIKTLEDIRRLLRAGADKVAINTAAIRNPEFIREASNAFGAQCIVISVHAQHRENGYFECLTDNARETTGKDVYQWIKQAEELGAGEILLTGINMEGTGRGYDIELIHKAAEFVNIPVIASGGAGSPEDVLEVIQEGKADAICAASLFHYGLLEQMNEADYSEEGNVDFLRNNLPIEGRTRKGIQPTSVEALKRYLGEHGVHCRLQREMAKV